jgi:hypothetical protein
LTNEFFTRTQPLQYLKLPYQHEVIEMISMLPPVLQDLAYEEGGLSLNMISYLAEFAAWARQALSNLSSISTKHDFNTGGPIYGMLTQLWGILSGLDPQSKPLERILCIAHYLMMMSSYYRRIVQRRKIFCDLRAEATAIALTFQPRNEAERDNLIVHGMLITQTWKTSSVLEKEGIQLLHSFRQRFREASRWETLEVVLMKFPSIAPAMAEKKDCWLQSCKD